MKASEALRRLLKEQDECAKVMDDNWRDGLGSHWHDFRHGADHLLRITKKHLAAAEEREENQDG